MAEPRNVAQASREVVAGREPSDPIECSAGAHPDKRPLGPGQGEVSVLMLCGVRARRHPVRRHEVVEGVVEADTVLPATCPEPLHGGTRVLGLDPPGEERDCRAEVAVAEFHGSQEMATMRDRDAKAHEILPGARAAAY